MTDPRSYIQTILPRNTPVAKEGRAFAPANIALCKYWGKRDEAFKLPLTGSLSVSLGRLGTHMRIRPADRDSLTLNGTEQAPASAISRRLFGFLDLFRDPGTALAVDSKNTLPTAAGLASSASAFAAAVLALNELFGWEADSDTLSQLARFGSGSACRSVRHGFMEWHPGERPDGSDSFATSLDADWPEFRIGILTVSNAPKPTGSGEGMKRTRDTSALYRSWPDQVTGDLPLIREAVRERDLNTLGRTAEHNALAMHATMIASWPPLIYWSPETLAALHRLHALREQGLPVYATLDAGPNIKLLFEHPSAHDLLREFADLQVVNPEEF